ncbi:MAG: McrC family protein [Bacteroides sp.]|nr:McrC family protein [Bacteroides sp.]
MITTDYSSCVIAPGERDDLMAIADCPLCDMAGESNPHLLVFPDSFDDIDENIGDKTICRISPDGLSVMTDSIVGFVGRNNTRLDIRSRFAPHSQDRDFFIHYMLMRICGVNIVDLSHSVANDRGFDFLIFFFVRALKRALGQGLFRMYVSRQYNDSALKGPVDVARHIRNNTPFNGQVAYNVREYSADNPLTQLVRHTIEYLSTMPIGRELLRADRDMREAVSLIRGVTRNYSMRSRALVISQNLKPVRHPLLTEYAALQRLSLAILRHEELSYGNAHDTVYGILIDAAWLWEEYMAEVLHGRLNHLKKSTGQRHFLFTPRRQQIIPDYISADHSIVADAKYIRLDRERSYMENSEKAVAILYKTITYMYRFGASSGFLFYPCSNIADSGESLTIDGPSGGHLHKIGLVVPGDCRDMHEFIDLMKLAESDFLARFSQKVGN